MNQISQLTYPFSAIVGQRDMKLALCPPYWAEMSGSSSCL